MTEEKLPSKDELMGRPLDNEEEARFIAEKVRECSEKLRLAQAEIATEIWGQDKLIEETLTCMVADGNLLLDGVPGLGKTELVSRIAKVMHLDSDRVQCTPDLMPFDILGFQRMKEDGGIEFIPGPIFTQFLMVDEINRTGPKTQSALLQAMAEKKVTVNGNTRYLRTPFLVMATQNPIEHAGTYPLSEAQLDRFMMKLDVDYPDKEAERKIMLATANTNVNIREWFKRAADGDDLTISGRVRKESKVRAILEKNDLVLMQLLAQRLPLSEKVADAILKIVRDARPKSGKTSDFIRDNVELGPGPRAAQAFAQVARARALMRGSLAPDVSDVLALVKPVMEHRMILKNSYANADATFSRIAKDLTHGI